MTPSSINVTFETFTTGVQVISSLYLQALTNLFDQKQNGSLSNETYKTIDDMFLAERGAYYDRLMHIFELKPNTSFEEIPIEAASKAGQRPEMKLTFDQETLAYHYQLTKNLITSLNLEPNDFIFPVITTDLSPEILQDLFPGANLTQIIQHQLEERESIKTALKKFDYTLDHLSKYNKRINELDEEVSNEEDVLASESVPESDSIQVENGEGIILEESVPGEEQIFSHDATTNLICSQLIWFHKDCGTDPDLYNTGSRILTGLDHDYTVFGQDHEWFKDWKDRGFEFEADDADDPSRMADQAMIQAMYLTLMGTMEQDLDDDKKDFVDNYLKNTAHTITTFLEVDALDSTSLDYPHSERQNTFALFEMIKISKFLISWLNIKPSQLSRSLPMNHPVVEELFESFVKNAALRNPALHRTLCDFMIVVGKTCFPTYHVDGNLQDLIFAKAKDKVANHTLLIKVLFMMIRG